MVRHHVTTRRAGNEASAPVQAVAFALNAGLAIDATSLIHIDPAPCQNRRLLLCVEPLEPSARGIELAALTLATIRETFAAAADLPPAAALMKAFTAANAVLINENRPLAGCSWERRVYVGATGIVLSGRELVIAQVPPTQAMIVQDGRLYAFPELASWRPDYLSPTDEAEPEPLGCREGTRPFLFRTVAAAGDLITLCSTALARQLGRTEAVELKPLLAGEPETTLEFLAELAVEHEMDDAHAAVVQIRRLSAERGVPRLAFPKWPSRATWPVVSPRVASAHRVGFLGATDDAALPAARPAYAVRTDWGAVGIPLDQPLPPAGPAWGAPNAGAAHRSRRLSLPSNLGLSNLMARFRSRPAAFRPAGPYSFGARRRFLMAPGVGSVRRYSDHATFPVEWRSNLPRGPELHVPTRVFTVGLVLFLAFGGSGALLDRYRTQVAQADAALATIDGSLHAIIANPAVAAEALATADAALAEARQAGADNSAIQRQALAVESARDLAWGNIRLTDLTRLGALPRDLTGSHVRLARTGHEIWLVGGGLYGLDQAENRLVQILAPGAPVQGGEVKLLHTGVSDGEQLIVVDDTALYDRDETGRWQRHFRSPAADDFALGSMPLAAYQRSLYALGPGGELLKFAADQLADQPEVWVSAADYPELLASADLAIDGQIHVLLSDGRILTFLRGKLKSIQTPAVTPELVSPRRLIGGADTNFLYLLETEAAIGPTTGRIVRLDASGNAVQILPPLPAIDATGAQPLSQARDLVIDEAAGLIYFITDTDLWRATLPR